MAEFLNLYHMKGFDRHRTPRWQMVPLLGERFVVLRDGAGLTVTNSAPLTVTFTEVPTTGLSIADREPIQAGDRIFKLEGKVSGAAVLTATTAVGAIGTSLELNVKARKTVNITYNFVKDNAGHYTRRATADAGHWIKAIDRIYNGQANIEIKLKLSRWVTVAQNLGRVVRFSSHIPTMAASEHEWGIVTAMGDTGADMNFFMVWNYEQDTLAIRDGTDAGTSGSNCLFEDRAGRQVAESMAHEVGHFLGCPDHYLTPRKRELMYGITDQRGVHLPKEDVNIMNP